MCIEICAANCKVPKRFGRCKYYEENCEEYDEKNRTWREDKKCSAGSDGVEQDAEPVHKVDGEEEK